MTLVLVHLFNLSFIFRPLLFPHLTCTTVSTNHLHLSPSFAHVLHSTPSPQIYVHSNPKRSLSGKSLEICFLSQQVSSNSCHVTSPLQLTPRQSLLRAFFCSNPNLQFLHSSFISSLITHHSFEFTLYVAVSDLTLKQHCSTEYPSASITKR